MITISVFKRSHYNFITSLVTFTKHVNPFIPYIGLIHLGDMESSCDINNIETQTGVDVGYDRGTMNPHTRKFSHLIFLYIFIDFLKLYLYIINIIYIKFRKVCLMLLYDSPTSFLKTHDYTESFSHIFFFYFTS